MCEIWHFCGRPAVPSGSKTIRRFSNPPMPKFQGRSVWLPPRSPQGKQDAELESVNSKGPRSLLLVEILPWVGRRGSRNFGAQQQAAELAKRCLRVGMVSPARVSATSGARETKISRRHWTSCASPHQDLAIRRGGRANGACSQKLPNSECTKGGEKKRSDPTSTDFGEKKRSTT